jgi:hypothetical protein
MQISKLTKKYFCGLHETRDLDEMLDLVESWLDVHYEHYDISLKQWIYNKGTYVNEFYDAIEYGTYKKTI